MLTKKFSTLKHTARIKQNMSIASLWPVVWLVLIYEMRYNYTEKII